MNTLQDFISTLDFKLVIAGFLLLFLLILILWLILVSISSIMRRKSRVRVSLPDVDEVDKDGSDGPAFDKVDELEIELIDDDDDDILEREGQTYDDDILKTALAIETKSLHLYETEDINMPEVEKIDLDAIEEEKRQKRKEKEREQLERLRRFAEEENEEDLFSDDLIEKQDDDKKVKENLLNEDGE